MHTSPGIPNELFVYERKKHHWTQKDVADRIDAPDQKTVRRWERGEVIPTPHYIGKLMRLFGKSAKELGFPPEGHISYWQMPHRRNPFFTGREDVLHLLRETFLATKTQPGTKLPVALSGLGGVGKTQTAIEYAYRYRGTYHTVLWLHAASYQDLVSDCTAAAFLLDLPGKETANPDQLIAAVKAWLTDLTHWLLILDNAEDLQMLENFLPAEIKGHILLTTQSQSTGTLAQRIDVAPMDTDKGAELLLRRAKLAGIARMSDHTVVADAAIAYELSEGLGGLPLALDQAGAYIDENQCSLADYLALFQRNQAQKMRLLQQRGRLHSAYPLSVVTTWSLAFEKIRVANPAAVELLHLCAFLAPDNIPEELLTRGVTAGLQMLAADAILFDQALGALLRYSFIRRNATSHMLTMHRLVQLVVSERLEAAEKRSYAELAVKAVQTAFPEVVTANYPRCRSLLPHVSVCFGWITQWDMLFPEAADLLHDAAKYLRQSPRRLIDSEMFYRQALHIREHLLGTQHMDVARTLYGLAITTRVLGRYEQADTLYLQALAIYEQQLGLPHPNTLSVLNDRGYLLSKQGRYDEAIVQHQYVLATRENMAEPDAYKIATSLMNLATAHTFQGNYQEAETLYKRALAIRERLEGPQGFSLAKTAFNLGRLYAKQGRYAEAEAFYQRAIAIREHAQDRGSSGLARTLKYLAALYCLQGEYVKAASCYHQAYTLWQDAAGLEPLEAAELLVDYGNLLCCMGKDGEATALNVQAQAIQEAFAPPG